jgi:hypothetical protein
VRSVTGIPSSGTVWSSSEIGVACDQTASFSVPSTSIGCSSRKAAAVGAAAWEYSVVTLAV